MNLKKRIKTHVEIEGTDISLVAVCRGQGITRALKASFCDGEFQTPNHKEVKL